MADVSSGQSPEHWKRKYLDQLDRLELKEQQWAQLENLLKRAIGRLSLAAEGHHRPLDQFIRDIRDSVRETVNQPRLESALEDLSRRLAKIEEKKSEPERKIISVLQQLVEALSLPEAHHKAQQKLIKRMSKATDDESEAITREWLDLLKLALVQTVRADEQKDTDKKPGLLNRLLGGGADDKAVTPATPSSEPVVVTTVIDDVDVYRGCLLSFLDKLDNPDSPDGRISAMRVMVRDAAHRAELEKLSGNLAALLKEVKTSTADSDTVAQTPRADVRDESFPSIQELLIRLLEQLVVPPDLNDEVDAMKGRLEKETAPDDWQQLLKDVALLINSIRSRMQQEKQEFETFLHQITDRLRELDGYLQTESVALQQAEKKGQEFNDRMTSGVRDIRNDMNQANDLNSLKLSVQSRLDVISQHILDYRKAEQNRYQEAQKNVADMQSRMSSLEQETSKLKTVLVEKNRQAMSDALTGIPNRLAYEKRVQEEIGRWKRFGTPLSVAVWDVDFFKKVNDTYGHKAGDKVLKTIAQLLAQRIRNTDFLARFGGEEFVMLLPGTKEEETLRLVNELRKQVEECGFHYHGKAVKITVSCGVSSFRENDTLEQVFERADKALYRAKKNGRNQCVIASVRSD
jgi:diguanylate cyclase